VFIHKSLRMQLTYECSDHTSVVALFEILPWGDLPVFTGRGDSKFRTHNMYCMLHASHHQERGMCRVTLPFFSSCIYDLPSVVHKVTTDTPK